MSTSIVTAMLRKHFISVLFCLLTLLISGQPAEAQSLQNIATVKVDQLTDAQIRQLLSKAQASGVSEQQLYTLAQQKGMPAIEVNKLRQRISQLGTLYQSQTQNSGAVVQGSQLRQSSPSQGEGLFESIGARDSLRLGLTDIERKIFGYSTFHNKSLNFSPNFNMATPHNYVVGPSDQLIIQVYGVAQESYTLTISPEGKINIPTIGLIHVGGFSIDAVSALLKEQLSKRFSGLRGSQPNTFLSVTIGNIRTIKVNIVGELQNPGTYTLPSFATVFNALYAAGGPTTKGTFRNIHIYRSGKLVSDVDIYEFLTNGEESKNVMLQDNDVILVRPIDRRVEIIGEVRTPGLFEVKKGESLSSVLYFAGGFTNKAYQQLISVRRNTAIQRKVETILQPDYRSFQPLDGDEYLIGEIIDRFSNRVQVSGSVIRPGEYELIESMTLTELINTAGGIQGDAFLSRATIYRTSQDFTLEAQAIDLKAVLDGSAPDVVLRNEDIINIPSRYDVRQEFYVQISGEVNHTGVFPYAVGLTVGDLILRAGGFKEAASSASIEIARRVKDDQTGKIAQIFTLSIPKNLELSDEDQSVILQPFDHIFVRRSPGYREQKLVSIDGEVNYPGTYALENATMRISDLVKRAGGLNQFAYPRGGTLVRRTEFYNKPNPDEEVVESLLELKTNTERAGIDNPASEKLLLERIDQKIKDGQEEIAKQQLEGTEAEATQFKLDLLSDVSQTNAKTIKETELVGINLDQIMASPGSKFDLILQEGDVIAVPKELQTVRLRGEVLYPTTTRFDKRRGFKDYITNAGGFSDQASKRKSYVIYANGNVKRTRSFLFVPNYPTIEPGAEIIVPLAPQRQRLSYGELITLMTSAVSLYILLSNKVF
ncbi:SLBB domain-containing protein [uncultured Imperialibacter sp.]|uniref:SLBB domain-containing protein n=1 Tax=uncultured Imperialibacter sp. TaxID=1672639 RepID=UPI0030DB40E4